MLTVNQQWTYIMEQKSKNTFYFDPDYENFVPHKTRLKWDSIDRGNSRYTALTISIGTQLVFLLLHLCCIGSTSPGWNFNEEGVNTTFTVIQCESLLPENSQVRVTYRYTLDGMTFSSTENSDLNLMCDDFPLGTLIEGQYRLTKPETSRITQSNFYSIWHKDWISFILFVICLPLPIVPVPLVRHLWLERKYHLLRTKGVVLDGELLNFYPERISSKGGGYIRVTIDYRYETPDGRLLEKRFIDTSAQRLLREMPQFLTPIKVLYANDHAVIMI